MRELPFHRPNRARMSTVRSYGRGSREGKHPLPAPALGLMVVLCIALLPGVPLPVWADAAKEPIRIRIGGTGGALGAMKLLAEEYQKVHPDTTVVVLPSMGSSGGIKALLSGALDIALSSRSLTEAERSLGAVEQEYARTPFVFTTSKKNRASGFTLREITDIYAGNTTSWPDGKPLRLVLRPAAEFDTSLLRSMSPDMDRAVQAALARKGMIVAITDQDSADAIEKTPGAFGTSTLAQIITEKRSLNVLPLDGVTPRPDAIADGTYPYAKTFSVVTRQDPPAHVRQFITFLFSSRGRTILTASGHLVINR